MPMGCLCLDELGGDLFWLLLYYTTSLVLKIISPHLTVELKGYRLEEVTIIFNNLIEIVLCCTS